METREQMKKLKENIFWESIATLTLSIACIDMFFIDFNLEHVADNIMWFVVTIFLIIRNSLSLVEDAHAYMYLKREERE